MALLTAQPRMRALERISGLSVIEGVPSRLAPEHEIERAALMLDVAASTFLMPGLRVQPFLGLDARPERYVAGQALVDGHPASALVALQALGAALERGVGAAELAGRDLGAARSGRGRDHEDEPDPEPRHHRAQAYPVAAATQT